MSEKTEFKNLFEGISISLLAQVFSMDKRDVAKALATLEPVGKREGFPIYSLPEAARYLVDPVVNMEDLLRTLKPKDLPVPLQDAFWKAQLSRLKYEEEVGQLVRVEAVKNVFLEVFKVFRLNYLLFSDKVEAQLGLTEEQRTLITGLSDDALEAVRRTLLEEFDLYSDEHDRPTADTGTESRGNGSRVGRRAASARAADG